MSKTLVNALRVFALVFIAVVLVAAPVVAFLYRAPLAITNTGGGVYDMLAVSAVSPNTWLAANDYMTVTARDSAVETLGGLVKPHMVSDTAILTASAVGIGSQVNLYYATGNTAADFDIITGNNGYITTASAPGDATQPGANFEFEFTGYTHTDNFPVVMAINGGNDVVNQLNHTVNLPTGIVAGDLLIVIFASDGTPAITFPPGDWTLLFSRDADAGSVKCEGHYRIANGTETATIVVTTDANQMTSHTSYRIVNYTGLPENVVTDGLSANPNPLNLAPTWDEFERVNLWLAVCANDGNQSVTLYPAGYTSGRNDRSADAEGVGVGSAVLLNDYGATEDPGTFTLSGADGWVADTIAIHNSSVFINKPAAIGVYVSGDEEISVAITGGATSVATGIVDGEHTIIVNDDTVNLRIIVDGVEEDRDAVGAVVPNNGNDWVLMSNANPYNTYYEEYVNSMVIPTGNSDPGGVWATEANAYDNNTGTAATTNIPATSWCDYLILTHAALDADRIDFQTSISHIDVTLMQLDIFDGAAWTSVYNGAALNVVWTIDEFPVDNVTQIRIRAYNSGAIARGFTVAEARWRGTPAIIRYQPATIITAAVLPDREVVSVEDGTITWGANPGGVAAVLGSMVSGSQSVPGQTVEEPTVDILPDTGTSDWFAEPDITGPLANNPLRPLVGVMSDSTTITERQAWVWFGLAFVLFVTVGVGTRVRGHHLITGVAVSAAIVALVVMSVWPAWTVVFIAIAIFGGLVSERVISL